MPLEADDEINIPPSIRAGRVPTPSSQLIFFLTGALAGATTLPIENIWQRLIHKAPGNLPLLAWNPIYRSAFRFWTFDLVRYRVERYPIPVAIKGGISGAAGGLAEICAQSLFRRKLPSVVSLTSQSAKLFCCFGIYTHLSTTLSPQQLPPKPFWYCWLMGAVAGGVGSGLVARAEGVTGSTLWKATVPKGALTIGMVIAVQVTTCAATLPYNPFIPGGRF